jgi:hypothetical protein
VASSEYSPSATQNTAAATINAGTRASCSLDPTAASHPTTNTAGSRTAVTMDQRGSSPMALDVSPAARRPELRSQPMPTALVMTVSAQVIENRAY